MSELLLLDGLLKVARDRLSVRLDDLYDEVAPPVVDHYVGGVSCLKAILFKLDQEGVVKNHIIKDDVFIDRVGQDTHLHRLVRLLRDTFTMSTCLADFTDHVFTSELNRHFLDAEEIRAVYDVLHRHRVPAPGPGGTRHEREEGCPVAR